MQNAADFKPGERVRLVKMNDPYRKDVPIGAEGTVISTAPKPVNVVNVKWDDAGFNLNPCLDVDVIERADRSEPQRVFEIAYKETYGGTFYVMAGSANEAYEKLQHYQAGCYLSREVECLDVTWTAAEAGNVRDSDINIS